ncbi:hypothetical protein LRS74_14815 [Streptomyces sp. LX-29]|uniref:hypothetical protein n=1 Tax=Streptomyces sp. LX-29 TaxID=2900152 RepID=UPI00240D460F|nr:hypothetical protein [Streptomyces sp. LX-29]WFB08181.1 hypothetical protein LRS74_14815 [Streptomyces sp. LX-29]
MLAVVADDRWPAAERRLAVRAAFGCDPGAAAPVLRRMLDGLAEPAAAARLDPDDELRGVALSMLWPHHLDVEAMLGALRPSPVQMRFGWCERFLSTMVRDCPDAWLGRVLEWLRAEAGRSFTTAQLTSLVDAVVDRALDGRDAAARLPALAAVVVGRFSAYKKVRFPAALDRLDPTGRELERSRTLRLAFADALVREAVRATADFRYPLMMCLQGWRRDLPAMAGMAEDTDSRAGRYSLLDHADHAWAEERGERAAREGESDVAAAYGWLADALSTDDADAGRSAGGDGYGYGRGEPHEAERDEMEPWVEAEAFAAEQRDRLRRARAGSADDFWQLVWWLQVDPTTGEGLSRCSDDIARWPGTSVLGPGAAAELGAAALAYVTGHHDHREEWLGRSLENRRALAGYLALALLHRQGRIEELPAAVWAAWDAAILEVGASFEGGPGSGVRSALLAAAARRAPEDFARTVDRMVRADLAAGSFPWGLRQVDAGWSEALREALERLARGLAMALAPAADEPPGADELPEAGGPVEARETAGAGETATARETRAARATGGAGETHGGCESAGAGEPHGGCESAGAGETRGACETAGAGETRGACETAGVRGTAEPRETPEADDAVGLCCDPLVIPEPAAVPDARHEALRLWGELLTRLLAADSEAARSLAWRRVERHAASADPEARVLAVRAAEALLVADAPTAWVRLAPLVALAPAFSRELAEWCARAEGTRSGIEGLMDEAGLVRLYHWLNALRPEDDIVRPIGAHVVDPAKRVGEWRESLPRVLGQRGTPEAVRRLKELVARHPRRLQVQAALVAARAQCAEATWTPVELPEVVALLAGAEAGADIPPLPGMPATEVLAAALEAFPDMARLEFRQGVLADLGQALGLGPGRSYPVGERDVAGDHLREVARRIHADRDPVAALRALHAALADARPDDAALAALRELVPDRPGG